MLVQQKRSPRFRWHDTQKLRTNTWNLWTHYEKYRIRKLDVPCGGKKCQLLFRESIGKNKWGTSLWCFSQLKLPRKNTNHHLSKYLSLQIPPNSLSKDFYLMVFPTHLKNMRVRQIGSSPQTSGWNFQKVLEVSPPTGFFFRQFGHKLSIHGSPSRIPYLGSSFRNCV